MGIGQSGGSQVAVRAAVAEVVVVRAAGLTIKGRAKEKANSAPVHFRRCSGQSRAGLAIPVPIRDELSCSHQDSSCQQDNLSQLGR